jgi:hypothetical protein
MIQRGLKSRCETMRHHQHSRAHGKRSPLGRARWIADRRVIYCAMRGERPYFDFSRRRVSGVGATWTPSACATSMISGFGGPPAPRVILTPLVVSTCAGVAVVWLTLAVVSGASSFRGAGKTSTFATANGSPLTGKSRRGSITRPTTIARIAATVVAPLVGRLRRTAGADAAPETKPSGSSSSSHTSVDAPRAERLRVANQPCPSLFSIPARGRPAHSYPTRGRESSVSFSPLIRVDAGFQ